jgi:hypothetical protein
VIPRDLYGKIAWGYNEFIRIFKNSGKYGGCGGLKNKALVTDKGFVVISPGPKAIGTNLS